MPNTLFGAYSPVEHLAAWIGFAQLEEFQLVCQAHTRAPPRLLTPLQSALVIPQHQCKSCGFSAWPARSNNASAAPKLLHRTVWRKEEAAPVSRGLTPLMESWKGRKRPWEDDSPIDLQFKRRGSTNAAPTVSAFRQPSPLPQRAGYYSRDNRILNQLPPLYTSSWNTSVAPTLSHSVQVSGHAQRPALLDIPRPRSQSLFNVFQHPHWQDHERYTGMNIFFELQMS